MSVGAVYDSSNYSFGSLASIRKQAYAIGDRVKAESAARRAEEDRTGLIQNPDTGEMVEISSISEKQREEWDYRHEANSVSPQEAMLAFLATAPNSDEVEESKALGAKYAKIQDKMLSGKKLTGKEMSFLQEHYPQAAALASRMEQESEQLEKRLQSSKSKQEAHQIYTEAKSRLIGGSSKTDGSILFLSAALDEAYARHTGRGSTTKKIDIWA